MTAITVGSTDKYLLDAPDNYAGINNQEPASPLLSGSTLWLVDPTQLGGETSDTAFPDVSVTNLTQTVYAQTEVPFNNLQFEADEITWNAITATNPETFESGDLTQDFGAIQQAGSTGTVSLSSSTPSSTVGTTTSQLSGTRVTTNFGSSSTGGATGGSGELADLSVLSGGGSGSGGGATGGGTTSGGTTSGGSQLNSAIDTNSPNSIETFNTQIDGGSGETPVVGDPEDVPFSLTESIGLSLLVLLVAGHKWSKRSLKAKHS